MKTIARLTTAMVVLALVTAASADEKEVTYANSGGVVKDANEKFFIAPFEKETGIKVKYVTTDDRLSSLEAMQKIGKVLWDLDDLSGPDFPLAVKRGLLEKLDYNVIDPDNKLPADAKQEYGVIYATYSDVLLQRLDKNPSGKKMTSWADFWDMNDFPGPRSLHKSAQGNLEFALLADGVEPSKLYEVLGTKEGLDRAFGKLDQIKPYIHVWWESAAQSVQLLADGEVFYSTSYNGRVQKLNQSGVPVEIVWNGGALHFSMLSIPKGAPNISDALAYIKFRTQRVDLNKDYLKILPYPGYTPGLFDGMAPELVKTMPTYPEHEALQFKSNDEWWSLHQELEERFARWLLQ
ncbi:ABC transporter substrate-binding protein [Mesorhizobium sp. M2A.F.Ca.ET.042.01.1.1]|uniref:ABC transporter substrate-binding protein n=1 Tax=Mesorhizobium sp. M2A.F.Ca.ET.042.01.1.1 TaxID=2496745 RepID=UPI000FCBB8AD|nr:ABC transporter substrate-binding protein [Mesorhizobium sp. M2A.F.Ca.ET.042.01.1.1]RUX19288.1 ABC transporter substrate-binding protein [Mesorhizobium sp. M2A.F.Ca.ET.042.01.1.1]